jgi:Domain of unknown function (DUF4386)
MFFFATTDRQRAAWAGLFFLTAIAAYATGDGLVQSVLGQPNYLTEAHRQSGPIWMGAAAMILNSLIVAGIGVLLQPILKKHHPGIARMYLLCRLAEALLLSVGVGCLLYQIGLSEQYSEQQASYTAIQMRSALATQGYYYTYQLAMLSLGVGSVALCALLYRVRLLPAWLALWGVAGYALLGLGALLEMSGIHYGIMLSIPGGLFELWLGIVLIIKGFNKK